MRDWVKNHDESRCWAGNTKAAPACECDHETGNDRCIEAVLGSHAAGNRQRHGQWNSDDTHADARQHIPLQACPAVRFIGKAGVAQGVADAKGEKMCSVCHSWTASINVNLDYITC